MIENLICVQKDAWKARQTNKSAIYEIPKERNTFENSLNSSSFIWSFPPIGIGDDGKKPLSGGVSGPFRLLKGVHWHPLSPTIIPTNSN